METRDTPALVEVRLLRVPLSLWQQARDRYDDLLRELALIHQGRESDPTVAAPARLIELTAELRERFGGISQSGNEAMESALIAGADHVDVTFRVPARAGPAAEDFLRLLEETDAWCREGALLTLAAPDDIARFRHWYLTEFTRQAAGEAPEPWRSDPS